MITSHQFSLVVPSSRWFGTLLVLVFSLGMLHAEVVPVTFADPGGNGTFTRANDSTTAALTATPATHGTLGWFNTSTLLCIGNAAGNTGAGATSDGLFNVSANGGFSTAMTFDHGAVINAATGTTGWGIITGSTAERGVAPGTHNLGFRTAVGHFGWMNLTLDDAGTANTPGDDTITINAAYIESELGVAISVGLAAAVVTNNSDRGPGSLRQAIVDSQVGGTIIFAAGLSGATITLATGQLVIDKDLTIDASALAEPVTIDANGAVTNHRVLETKNSARVVLDSLVLTGGNPGSSVNGGGILNGGTLTLNRCTVSDNSGQHGGGIFSSNRSCTITNSTLARNTASRWGGGIYFTSRTLTLRNSTCFGNSAGQNGGVFSNENGTAILENVTIVGNSANGGGGFYKNSSGSVSLRRSIVAGNTATAGPDIFSNSLSTSGINFVGDPSGSSRLASSTLLTGDPLLAELGDYGGPTETMPPLPGSRTIDSASATDPGGTDQRGAPRFVDGMVDIGAVEHQHSVVTTEEDEDSVNPGDGFSLREALALPFGGTITFDPSLNGKTITLANGQLLIDKNLTTIDGSALSSGITIDANGEVTEHRVLEVAANTTVALYAITVTGGRGISGSGISNQGSLTMTRCTVFGNETTGTGGGIFTLGTLALENCTVANNTSAKEGGGILNNSTGSTFTHCTISGNTANGYSGGGGGRGGGIFSWHGFTVSNTIIFGNTASAAGADIAFFSVRSLVRNGWNLGRSIANASQVGSGTIGFGDPKLAPLGNYGGPTPTLLPLPGSAAIDAVTGPTPATDQRGLDRPQIARPDVGAVEALVSAVSPAAGADDVTLIPSFIHTAPAGSLFELFLATDRDELDDNSQGVVGNGHTPDPLAPGTTYFWRMDITFGGETYPGVVYTFTTRPPLFVDTAEDENDGVAAGMVSLRDAIAAAVPGEIIQFDSSLSGKRIVLSEGELVIEESLTIDASGLDLGITIDANGEETGDRVFRVEGGVVTMKTLTITGGKPASDGGGIRLNGGTLVLLQTTLHRNASGGGGFGGAIYKKSGATLNVTNSTIAHNRGGLGGGIYAQAGPVNLTHVTMTQNLATSTNGGGGLRSSGADVTLSNTIIAQNDSVSGNGPDLAKSGGTITGTGINFIGNLAHSGLFADETVLTGDARLSALGYYGGPTQSMHPLIGSPVIDPAGGTAFDGNLPTDQRGLSRAVDGGRETGASAIVDIGAVEAGPVLEVSNTTDNGANSLFAHLTTARNDAERDGFHVVFLEAAVIKGTTYGANSSAVFIDASDIPAPGIQISGENLRTVFSFGPRAVTAMHSVTIRDGKGSSVGGINAQSSDLTLVQSTVMANSGGSIGGINTTAQSRSVLDHCSIVNNESTIAGGFHCGALFVNNPTRLRHCTVTQNSAEGATSPGGIRVWGDGHLTLENSIVAGNLGVTPDFSGRKTTARGVNLIGDLSGSGLTAGENVLVGDPLFGQLGDYGGPTPTVPLLLGSPAIDAAANLAVPPGTDQRGFPRGIDGDGDGTGGGDLGAFETGITLVTSAADDGAGTLREAIEGPNSANIIRFDPDVFDGSPGANTIALASGLQILDRTLSIDASTLERGVTLNGGGHSRLFVRHSGTATIRNLTISNCRGAQGGGVRNDGTLTLLDSAIVGNHATILGGGILNNTTKSLSIVNSTIANNTVTGDGGGIFNNAGACSLTNVSIVNNSAGGNGGGMRLSGGAELRNTIVAGNRASRYSDILGSATSRGGNLIGDKTGMSGITHGQNDDQAGSSTAPLDARLAPLGHYGGLTPTMPLLVGSPAKDKGVATNVDRDQRGFDRDATPDVGAYEVGPVLTVTTTSNFEAGSLETLLHGVTRDGTHIVFSSAFDGEDRDTIRPTIPLIHDAGTAVFIDASDIPAGVTVSGAGGRIGFRVVRGSNLALYNLTVREGAPHGLHSDGALTLLTCRVLDSQRGITTSGALTVLNSTISGQSDGGIHLGDGTLLMENSTVANNRLGQNSGSGLRIQGEGVATIRHSTIAGNLAGTDPILATLGAGITIEEEAKVTLENTIVANNIAGAREGGDNAASDILGNFTTIGVNLVEVHSGGSLSGPAPLSADPDLSPLADNGGPTQTMMLRPGSPAIDAGPAFDDASVAALFTDQRGFPRLLNGSIDLGAYEAGARDDSASGLTIAARMPPHLTTPGVKFEISTDLSFLPSVTTESGAAGALGFQDGPRHTAQFSFPSGVTKDSLGNVFIADTANNRIRMLSGGGEVSTIAGTGAYGLSDGPGETATFSFPAAVAVGPAPAENIYVADTFNHCIRVLTRPAVPGQQWTVATLAGNGLVGVQPEEGESTGANSRFSHPHGLVVDADNNVFVADSGNHRICKITAGGMVSIVAGSAKDAPFDFPTGVVLDSARNLFVADRDNHVIRRITPGGAVSILAGQNQSPGSTDGSTSERFNSPSALAIDHNNNLYVADKRNHAIRKVTPAGTVSTIAGTRVAGFKNGIATEAQFDCPTGIVVDLRENPGNPADPRVDLLIADSQNHLLRRIQVDPLKVDAVVDTDGRDFRGVPVTATLDASVLGLTPNVPYYFRWVSQNGELTTQDAGQSFVLVDPPLVETRPASPPTSATVATLNAAITPNHSNTRVLFEYSTDPNLAGPLRVSTPATDTGFPDQTVRASHGVAVDRFGNVYLSDRENHQVWKIWTDGSAGLLAGSFDGEPGFDENGTGRLDHPGGLAVAGDTLYVADEFNHCIRTININGGGLETIGSRIAGFADGNGEEARFLFPVDVASDSDGNIYVADRGNHRIRRLVADGPPPGQTWTISTVAGTGTEGASNGDANSAQFSDPSGLAVDPNNNVYVADTGNHLVRRITAGNVFTLAGSGTTGAVDGPGAIASFSSPTGVAVDPDGNLLIADRDNHLVRRVTAAGEVSTFAGSGLAGATDSPVGKMFPATSAEFDLPVAIAADDAGRVYVVEDGETAYRKIDRDPVATVDGPQVVAGDTSSPPALVGAATDIPLMPGATYYFRAIGTNGRNTPVAGEILSVLTPQSEIVVHLGASTVDPVLTPGGVVDLGGTPLNVTLDHSFTIENIGDSDLSISAVTLVGEDSNNFDLVGVGGVTGAPISPGESATFQVSLRNDEAAHFSAQVEVVSNDQDEEVITFTVEGVVLDRPVLTNVAHGDVTATGVTLGATVNPKGSATEVAFEFSKFSDFEGTLEVLTKAGSEKGFANGCGRGANFDTPWDVAADQFGNVYVADTLNHRIRKITPNGDCTVLAGSGDPGYADGTDLSAQFNAPRGIAVDPLGNVFVADTLNHRIRKITPDGEVSTVAGFGGAAYTDGVAAAARFNEPIGIDIGPDGTLYVADSLNKTVRIIANGEVSSTDYEFFQAPQDVAIRADGKIFVADTVGLSGGVILTLEPELDMWVRVGGAGLPKVTGLAIDDAGTIFATLADHRVVSVTDDSGSTPVAGVSLTPGADDGKGADARFNLPTGIAVSPSGTIYVADRDNHRIRQIDLAARTVIAASDLNGEEPLEVEVVIDGLDPNTEYFYRALASNGGGTAMSATGRFTTLNNASALVALTVNGEPVEGFDPCVYSYTTPPSPATATIVATAESDLATIRIYENGVFLQELQSGISTTLRNLKAGDNIFDLEVISEDRTATRTYRINITRDTVSSPFITWQGANFGANSGNDAIAGPLADPSDDGVVNLRKYAHLLDPSVRSRGGLPEVSAAGNNLTLTFNKNLEATDVVFEVQCSSDLLNWVSAENLSEDILSDDGTVQRIRAAVPRGPRSKFIRLSLTLQQP